MIEARQQLFRDIDLDGSGTLEMNEMATLCADLGLPLTPAQLHEAMGEMDGDKSGSIDPQELIEWLKTHY